MQVHISHTGQLSETWDSKECMTSQVPVTKNRVYLSKRKSVNAVNVCDKHCLFRKDTINIP